jgi:hypothetical protein
MWKLTLGYGIKQNMGMQWLFGQILSSFWPRNRQNFGNFGIKFKNKIKYL